MALLVLLAPDLYAQPTKPPTRKPGNGDGQDTTEKEIDDWIHKLHLTGPEAKAGRDQAVDNLMSMNNPRAHEPLTRALARAVDDKPEHLVLADAILTALHRSFANHRHTVFGTGANRDVMRRTYMRPLVQLYVPLVDGKAHVLQRAAGACLRQLATAERIAGAQLLLKIKNPKLQKATLLALGDCWDLGMAPFLAGYLNGANSDQASLTVYAILALKMLTFEDLRTKAEFDAWWAANKEMTYVEIAIHAARAADRTITEREQRNAEEIRRLYEQIVDVVVTSKTPDRWKRIQGYIFAQKPGVMQACLLKLRDRLRTGLELKGGAEATDRLALLAALHEELVKPEVAPARYALLLEVTSQLIAPSEVRERAVQEDLLRQGLGHASVDVGLAALRGLRQFPSPDNRLAIVRMAKRVRGADSDRRLVAEAVATLKSASWTAPLPMDKDYEEWQEVLSLLLADTKLDGVLRQEVVKALAKADKNNGHPDGVQRELSTVAGRASEDLSLRQAALLELPQVLTDAASADNYVRFLVTLLEDKEDGVRREAATQLKRLPYDKDRASEKRGGWQKLLLENLAFQQLLGSEKNDKVFEVLVECLVRLAKDNPDHSSAVGDRLWRAVETIHKDSKPESAFKIPVLNQGIVNYATAKERNTIEWVRSCEALIAVGHRQGALTILAARTVKLDSETPGNGEIRARYQQMRVQLALLRKDTDGTAVSAGATGNPWSGKTLREEAGDVITALEALAAQKPPAPEVNRADVRVLWLRCLAGVDQHPKLIALATPWLSATTSDNVLINSHRTAAILLLAMSELEMKKPKQAVAWIGKLGAGTGVSLPKGNADLILIERIATLLVASVHDKTAAAAAASGRAPGTPDPATVAAAQMLAKHLVTNTDQKDPSYSRRQLLNLEAQSLGADKTVRAGLRGQLDRLFGGDGTNAQVPAALKARVARLRKELGG
ncbi:MAG: hypothetical protein ACYS5W_10435 [Planctomycetota bacterium]|jgi:hypothetical protein